MQEREDQPKLRRENLEKERISVEEWLLEKPTDIQHSRRWRDGNNYLSKAKDIGNQRDQAQNQQKEEE